MRFQGTQTGAREEGNRRTAAGLSGVAQPGKRLPKNLRTYRHETDVVRKISAQIDLTISMHSLLVWTAKI